MQAGNRYFQQGVYNEALARYEAALVNYDYSCNIHLCLARAALALGLAGRAEYHLRYSLKYCPADAEGYALYAALIGARDPALADRIRAASGLPAAALAAVPAGTGVPTTVDECLALAMSAGWDGVLVGLAPLDREVRLPLITGAARRCRDGLRPDEAVRLYDEALALGGDPGLGLAAGNTLFAAGDHAGAAAYFLRYTRSAPDGAAGYFNLGIIYLVDGLAERSRVMFERAGPGWQARAEAVRRIVSAGQTPVPVE